LFLASLTPTPEAFSRRSSIKSLSDMVGSPKARQGVGGAGRG
jgi:hypothetical protein